LLAEGPRQPVRSEGARSQPRKSWRPRWRRSDPSGFEGRHGRLHKRLSNSSRLDRTPLSWSAPFLKVTSAFPSLSDSNALKSRTHGFATENQQREETGDLASDEHSCTDGKRFGHGRPRVEQERHEYPGHHREDEKGPAKNQASLHHCALTSWATIPFANRVTRSWTCSSSRTEPPRSAC